jgi:hypothetical protein
MKAHKVSSLHRFLEDSELVPLTDDDLLVFAEGVLWDLEVELWSRKFDIFSV